MKEPHDISGYDSAALVTEDLSPQERALARFGGYEPDNGRAYWQRAVEMVDAMHATYCVLDAHQLDRLEELRDRLGRLTTRESSFLAGLWTECLGVASAENAQ